MNRKPSTASKTQPSKGKWMTPKAPWLVVGGTGLVLALGYVFLFGPAGVGIATSQDQPHVTAIPTLAPSDSDTFVVAPESKDWWAKISAMASPDMGLAGLDPSAAGVSIDNIGYSRSQDHAKRDVEKTGPLRLFYVETPNADAAGKVADWLRGAPGYEGRRVYVSGRIVVVCPSWVNAFEAPAASMDKVPGYAAQVTSGTASMWRNVDQEVPSIVGDATNQRAAVISTVLSKGYGFEGHTTWVGTSKTGDSWSGVFKSGGVNPSQLDFKATMDAVSATQKVLAKAEFSSTKYEVLDSGLSEVLTGASFVAPNQSQRLGGAMPANTPSVKDAVVTAVTDVTRFNAAASGITSSEENVSTQSISANQHEMVISFGYQKQG